MPSVLLSAVSQPIVTCPVSGPATVCNLSQVTRCILCCDLCQQAGRVASSVGWRVSCSVSLCLVCVSLCLALSRSLTSECCCLGLPLQYFQCRQSLLVLCGGYRSSICCSPLALVAGSGLFVWHTLSDLPVSAGGRNRKCSWLHQLSCCHALSLHGLLTCNFLWFPFVVEVSVELSVVRNRLCVATSILHVWRRFTVSTILCLADSVFQ